MVVSIVALLILGPERLPETLRTLGLWMGRLRRSFTAVKTELEKEIGMDDIRRQLHNESVMEEMQRIEAEVQNSLDTEDAAAQNANSDNSIMPPTTSQPEASTPDADSTAEPEPDQPANLSDDRVNNS